MVDQEQIIRAASEGAGDEVILVEERRLETAVLTLWRGRRAKPARTIAVFHDGDEILVTTKSLAEFEKMLRRVKPSFNDIEFISWLVENAAPPRRKVLRNVGDVDVRYRSAWSAPSAHDQDVSLFCHDFAKGRVENFIIHRDYTLTVRDIGPGRRIAMR